MSLNTEPIKSDAPSQKARLPRQGLLVWISVVVIAVTLFCALLGPFVTPHDPDHQDLFAALEQPSSTYWLGTDELGRDVFSRIVVGASTAMLGPVLVALGSMLIGATLGLLAGYLGGTVDGLISRGVELVLALPALLVAIVVVGVVGGGYWVAVSFLIVVFAPFDIRTVRGATLEQASRPYVEAARTLGLPTRTVLRRHIFPNVLPVIVNNLCLNFSFALVTLASLSYLGLGVRPGAPDWGRMLSDSRNIIFDVPVPALAPGMAIVLLGAAVSIVGDALYEHYSTKGETR